MSADITPSKKAIEQRKEIERLIPIVAQKAAEHIVSQLEPRFSEAHAEGYSGTFEEFLVEGRYGHGGRFYKVLDRHWIEGNGVSMVYIGELREACEPIIQQLLKQQYGVTAVVAVRNGGGPEFIFDWYECIINRPQPEKPPFWQFWRR